MPKDPIKTDATVEPTATPSATVSSTSEPITTGDIFDFTVGVEVMDGPTIGPDSGRCHATAGRQKDESP
jgi:hypothetical protein